MFGPPAPVKKKAPARSGPIQPAFPPEVYQMESPWSQLQVNPEAETMKNYLPPVPEAPMSIKDTRLSESPFDRANVQMVGPTDEGKLPLQIDPNYVQRPTIGTKMGESASSKLSSEIANAEKSQRDTYLAPEEWSDLTGTIRGTPEVQDMLQAQADREEMLASMMGAKSPVGVDLTPLMALTDQWSGSKFTNSYKPPNATQDQKLLLEYGDKALDNKQKLMETILKGAQYLKSGSATDQLTQKLLEAQAYGIENKPPPGARGFKPPDESVKAARFLNTFKNIETVKDANKELAGANEVLGNIANPNWLTDSAIKAAILKTMALFPVSDRDASMVEGGQAIKDQVERLYLKYKEGGRFLPSDREVIKNYAMLKKKAKEAQISEVKKEYAATHGPKYGYNMQEGLGLIEATTPKSFYEQPKLKPTGPSKQSEDIKKLLQDALK